MGDFFGQSKSGVQLYLIMWILVRNFFRIKNSFFQPRTLSSLFGVKSNFIRKWLNSSLTHTHCCAVFLHLLRSSYRFGGILWILVRNFYFYFYSAKGQIRIQNTSLEIHNTVRSNSSWLTQMFFLETSTIFSTEELWEDVTTVGEAFGCTSR
jgi:hypothetical protein